MKGSAGALRHAEGLPVDDSFVRSGLEVPKRANSMEKRIVDLPEPISPDNNVEPLLKLMVSSV